VFDVGVDGVIVNLPTHGYTPGIITDVGEALKPLVSPDCVGILNTGGVRITKRQLDVR
jgi:hypothetical protein